MGCKYSDKDLMLNYYNESDPELEAHLMTCNKCMARLNRLERSLDKIRPEEPEMPDAFWSNFSVKVNEKIDKKEAKGRFYLLRPKIAMAAMLAILISVAFTGGVRIYEEKQDREFIMENYDLIMNINMLEDLELLENFEAPETA